MLYNVVPFLKTSHDVAMCCTAVVVMVGLEGFNKDTVAVAVVSKHDVLVATAGAGGEASHVICVESADGIIRDMKFLRGDRRGLSRRCDVWGGDGWFGFGGEKPLACLGEMAFGCFSAVGAVFGSIGVSKACPAGVVAGFDGS